MNLISDSLLLPALGLGFLGFLVPRLLARVLPEGVKPLMPNALLSTFILFVLAGLGFFLLYVGQGADAGALLEPGLLANVVFFGRLGLASALIWAPIMVLSVAALPRRWVKETW